MSQMRGGNGIGGLFTDGFDPIMDVDVGGPKKPKRAKQRWHSDDDRHIGCPIWWLRLVSPVVKGKRELIVAVYLFRLRAVHRSKTVKVPNGWLRDAFGISRHTKYRALKRLALAKLIKTKQCNKSAIEVTFVR
jgi:hypothetical protein